MGIFKKPKFLIIGGAVLLAAIVLTVALVSLVQPTKIGFFGLNPKDAETIRMQKLLEDEGYAVYYAETLEDLQSTDCKAWIVRASSNMYAQMIVDSIGDKAIFIGSPPALSQPVRFAGWDMEEAGKRLAELLPRFPSCGDTNEDGTVSCLLLAPPEGYKEKADWMKGLEAGMASNQLSCDILDVCACSASEEAGNRAATDSLSAYGRDIEVILASGEALAEGVAQAIRQGGWSVNEDFYLLAVGHTELSIDALNSRQYSGLVHAQWADFDDLLLTAVADTIDGKDPQAYLLPFTSYHSPS